MGDLALGSCTGPTKVSFLSLESVDVVSTAFSDCINLQERQSYM